MINGDSERLDEIQNDLDRNKDSLENRSLYTYDEDLVCDASEVYWLISSLRNAWTQNIVMEELLDSYRRNLSKLMGGG